MGSESLLLAVTGSGENAPRKRKTFLKTFFRGEELPTGSRGLPLVAHDKEGPGDATATAALTFCGVYLPIST